MRTHFLPIVLSRVKERFQLSELLLFLLLFSHASIVAAQGSGTFIPTGSMTTPRIGHTATLLLNGKVLITGGGRSSAELFDPATGMFTTTGDMTTSRSGSSATLLSDGRVLIAGGGIGEGRNFRWLASSEIYDPSTETFTPAGTMLAPHAGHTATLLNSGKVLIDEGCTDTGVAEPELYNPVTDTFSRAWDQGGPFLNPCGSAVLLPDGRVFTVRGPGAYDVAVAGLYDPATGEFSRTGLRKINGVYDTPVTLLVDGTVLIAGGYDECTRCRSGSAELFDPVMGTFTVTGSMMRPRADYTATLLRDGTVLVAGGDLSPESAELYDPVTGTFAPAGDMVVPRRTHTATLLMDGRILIAGGYTTSYGISNSAELYNPSVLVPAQVVTDLRFDRTSVEAGSTYSVNISGSNLTPQAFFDVRFSAPRSNASDVVLNWQRGLEVSHDVSAGTVPGSYTIIGVRAHEVESDHTGIFFPVSATLTVSRQPSDTTIYPGDFLLPGQSRQSADGRFRLVYQVDGNLVLYQGSNPLWASATYGTTLGFVAMQADGNFVVYDSTRAVWASDTWGHPGAFLVVQDDGNTVIYSPGSSPLWATNTCCR